MNSQDATRVTNKKHVGADECVGYAGLANQHPITPEILCDIASRYKAMPALAILLLKLIGWSKTKASSATGHAVSKPASIADYEKRATLRLAKGLRS